ncbi:MAG TPA: FAD-dependent oxidoreductase [Kofleriaceae bacterium]|nr:FAD-dependent oxidoreductase [Kofleriaceae bacterium]
MQRSPHVVVIGGGFGGLAAARALANAPVRVTLIDRRNHHLFQPLLYQVATAALCATSPRRHSRRSSPARTSSVWLFS